MLPVQGGIQLEAEWHGPFSNVKDITDMYSMSLLYKQPKHLFKFSSNNHHERRFQRLCRLLKDTLPGHTVSYPEDIGYWILPNYNEIEKRWLDKRRRLLQESLHGDSHKS